MRIEVGTKLAEGVTIKDNDTAIRLVQGIDIKEGGILIHAVFSEDAPCPYEIGDILAFHLRRYDICIVNGTFKVANITTTSPLSPTKYDSYRMLLHSPVIDFDFFGNAEKAFEKINADIEAEKEARMSKSTPPMTINEAIVVLQKAKGELGGDAYLKYANVEYGDTFVNSVSIKIDDDGNYVKLH